MAQTRRPLCSSPRWISVHAAGVLRFGDRSRDQARSGAARRWRSDRRSPCPSASRYAGPRRRHRTGLTIQLKPRSVIGGGFAAGVLLPFDREEHLGQQPPDVVFGPAVRLRRQAADRRASSRPASLSPTHPLRYRSRSLSISSEASIRDPSSALRRRSSRQRYAAGCPSTDRHGADPRQVRARSPAARLGCEWDDGGEGAILTIRAARQSATVWPPSAGEPTITICSGAASDADSAAASIGSARPCDSSRPANARKTSPARASNAASPVRCASVSRFTRRPRSATARRRRSPLSCAPAPTDRRRSC